MAIATPFGRQLKAWRRQRGVSQLELATRAQLSQRHVSFIETGRSRPGEGTVHRLAEALQIPLRERNGLLEAAGLPALYPELPLTDAALAPFKEAVARLLAVHEPFPAFVINRWWDVVDGNRAARRLMPLEGGVSFNFVDAFFSPGPLREMVDNYLEVAWTALRRLRAEVAQLGTDERLEALLASAEKRLGTIPAPVETSGDLVACPNLRVGDQLIRTISMVARFSNTREVTVDELRVEVILPRDAQAEAFFRTLSEG